MLTKNFYSYMRTALQKVYASFTLTGGTTKSLHLSSSYSDPPFAVMNKWSVNNAGYGVSFGTGTEPSTASDYALQSPLSNTQISVVAPSEVNYSRGDTFDEYSVSFGVTNNTSDAITISEVGLFSGASDSSSSYLFIVDRTVLDAPVTIPAHQTKHIAYTIRFNYGDAS